MNVKAEVLPSLIRSRVVDAHGFFRLSEENHSTKASITCSDFADVFNSCIKIGK